MTVAAAARERAFCSQDSNFTRETGPRTQIPRPAAGRPRCRPEARRGPAPFERNRLRVPDVVAGASRPVGEPARRDAAPGGIAHSGRQADCSIWCIRRRP
ncbi:hypothetical protein MYA_2668 [Burkholderia sp. KJ006]|nr:hypothetical protein MYA_2668 [Burkholderia sp. KJ006]